MHGDGDDLDQITGVVLVALVFLMGVALGVAIASGGAL